MAKAKEKEVVEYIADDAIIGNVGGRAIVKAVENVGTDYYRHTTEILSHDAETGTFETTNTIYKVGVQKEVAQAE